MNANVLKLIGIIGMVLDHIGLVLFPDMAIFHFIGRITFPIFCVLSIFYPYLCF